MFSNVFHVQGHFTFTVASLHFADSVNESKVHSDNVEIIEFSFVIYDAKETVCSLCRQPISCKHLNDIEAQRMVLEGQHYCKNTRSHDAR